MKEALETILKASETAGNVLDRFKKLAQGSDQELKLSLVNLVQPVDEALDLMGHQFKKQSINILKPHYEQVLIEGAKHSLVQVCMNLLINACYVMPEGGTIEVSVAKKGTDQAEIRIHDQGPGIPQELLEKVLEPLFTTKGNQGSGLGLAICQEIIEIEHRGQFQLHNHPQGGLEVVITLPTRQVIE